MRACLFIILIGLFACCVKGQISFSPVDSKLQKSNDELICSTSTMTVKFPLKREVTVLPQNNLATVDSQTIQIMSLKFDGYNKNTNEENFDNQKELLIAYSKYELDYFTELGVEVINPNNQWVVTKSRGWFIWYFKVGSVPTQVEQKTEIQLFAATIIGDKVFIINAPILTGGDFKKAAYLVNDMMEALVITKQ